MKNEVKKIVVLGGGFAGINFIKRLANDNRFEVILVDHNNYHLFAPLLYQVAMAFIEPSNISYPFRRLFQKKSNLRFHLGSLVRVDQAVNSIEIDTGKLNYDYLVIALGTESNYFGMKNVEKNSWPLKTINDATNLRNHMLLNMEKAVRCVDVEERQMLLNVVIAGGGPTGVEVAGMLAEMIKNIGLREYPEVSNVRFPIYLIGASPVLLGPMSKKAQNGAFSVLEKLGVQLKMSTAVKDYVNGKVIISNGEVIPASSLIWTSGVIGIRVPGLSTDSVDKGRRIKVDPFNKVTGTENIFAIGDISLQTSDSNFPKGHPQLAQVIQQGQLLASNVKRKADGLGLKPFVYNDKGSIAIISKYKAVVDLPRAFVRGFVAWMIWVFIHLVPITSFRNKVKLAFSWVWSFITNDPTLRLIIRPKTDSPQ